MSCSLRPAKVSIEAAPFSSDIHGSRFAINPVEASDDELEAAIRQMKISIECGPAHDQQKKWEDRIRSANKVY
mgnify:CR=1 FL=1